MFAKLHSQVYGFFLTYETGRNSFMVSINTDFRGGGEKVCYCFRKHQIETILPKSRDLGCGKKT